MKERGVGLESRGLLVRDFRALSSSLTGAGGDEVTEGTNAGDIFGAGADFGVRLWDGIAFNRRMLLSPQDSGQTEPATRIRYAVIGTTTLAAVMLYLDRICIAEIAKLESFRTELGLDAKQVGAVMSAFFFSYALAQVPAGVRRLALIGEAVGGKPVTQLTEGEPTILSATSAGQVRDLFAFRFEDFTLEGYDPHPHIAAPVAV